MNSGLVLSNIVPYNHIYIHPIYWGKSWLVITHRDFSTTQDYCTVNWMTNRGFRGFRSGSNRSFGYGCGEAPNWAFSWLHVPCFVPWRTRVLINEQSFAIWKFCWFDLRFAQNGWRWRETVALRTPRTVHRDAKFFVQTASFVIFVPPEPFWCPLGSATDVPFPSCKPRTMLPSNHIKPSTTTSSSNRSFQQWNPMWRHTTAQK
jgi:hypothetical protein